jgi:hypothetical protein
VASELTNVLHATLQLTNVLRGVILRKVTGRKGVCVLGPRVW